MAQGLDGRGAHAAGLSGATIDRRVELEITVLPIGVFEIAQAAAARGQGLAQDRHHRCVQTRSPRLAQPVGGCRGANAGHEQRLRRVDIAHAHHHITAEQDGFDGAAALLQSLVKSARLKTALQRLAAQTAQELVRHGIVQPQGRVNHGTKAARVVQPEHALAGVQLHVIVWTALGQVVGELHMARHAQMHQEQAAIQIDEQIFAAPPHRQDALALQGRRRTTQRPAQGFTHEHTLDHRASDAVGKAQTGDFNFGQFGHGQSGLKAIGHGGIHYHDPMTQTPRSPRQDPTNTRLSWCRPVLTTLAAGLLVHSAAAAPVNSALNSRLFLHIVAAEMYAQSGDSAKAFQLMQEAARQQRDPDLYRRAVNLALQAGAGGSALTAARAWRTDFPASDEAQRFELQILLALNRLGETGPVLKALLMGVKGDEQVNAINGIPNIYTNVKDKTEALRTVRSAFAGVSWSPAAAVAFQTSLGRMALAAGDLNGALQATQEAHRLDPTADWPALLALGLLEQGQNAAEPMVKSHAAATASKTQQPHTVALAYARVLLNLERWSDARVQLLSVQQRWPQAHDAWLLMGTLHVQANETELAEAALRRYLDLSAPSGPTDARTQALVQLASLAEKRGDMTGATAWLDQIPASHDVLSAHIRRASVLRQQGLMTQARETLRQAPERRTDDARLKLMAEAQLLRDAQDHAAAYEVYAQAVTRFPQDPDLVYEQASMAEKLERWDDMERLLKGLIQSHPNYQHAYNALGYSWADRNVRLSEAKALIEQAVALAPQDGYILDSLGWVEFRLGNHAQALAHLQRAFELKADAEIAAHWGEVLWIKGDRDAALAIWRKGWALNADNNTLRKTLQRFNAQP